MPDGDVPGGKDGVQHAAMAHDLAPSRGGVRHREEAGRGGRGGVEPLPADLTREADLLVEPAQRRFDRGQLSLHFDHEQRGGRSMKAEDVDRAELAEDVAGHLDRVIPAETRE